MEVSLEEVIELDDFVLVKDLRVIFLLLVVMAVGSGNVVVGSSCYEG